MEAKPQMDLHAKVYRCLIFGQDSGRIGKSSTGQLFEGKGDSTLINTAKLLFSEKSRDLKKFLPIDITGILSRSGSAEDKQGEGNVVLNEDVTKPPCM